MLVVLLVACALIWLVMALTIHETGHYVAARWRGFPARIVFRWAGPGVLWGNDGRVSTGRERAAVSLAGPAASVALAAATWVPANTETINGLIWIGATLISLLVAVLNLVPFGPSDGKHALNALRNSGA